MSEAQQKQGIDWSVLWRTEDWGAVWIGIFLLFLCVAHALPFVQLPGSWGGDVGPVSETWPAYGLLGLLGTVIFVYIINAVALYFQNENIKKYTAGFAGVIILSLLSYFIGKHDYLSHYGFNQVIWALVLGLVVSNFLAKLAPPDGALRYAARTEQYIKTGLVLLGARIMFDKLLLLGAYGVGVAWTVTPIVIIFMFWFALKVLKMHEEKEFAITIASATSVCGVSAAIAAGASAKAKKEHISVAIGVTLIFTVIMMVVMPAAIAASGMNVHVGGAWLGGTIDSTGAVVAAGAMLGDQPMEIAAVIKMIQNVMIGIIAFAVAVFWVLYFERGQRDKSEMQSAPKEIWIRLPKFVLGFVFASLVFTFFLSGDYRDHALDLANSWRGLFFVLAFVSIGLESNFKEMARVLEGGKPLILYIVGQSLNLVLTFIAAYILFSGQFLPPVY
jgi:uncharacterized integral membrane protein (TIGR00698 family)